jgi:hypothetical protein
MEAYLSYCRRVAAQLIYLNNVRSVLKKERTFQEILEPRDQNKHMLGALNTSLPKILPMNNSPYEPRPTFVLKRKSPRLNDRKEGNIE